MYSLVCKTSLAFDCKAVVLFPPTFHKSTSEPLINSFSPELRSRPLDDTVKFIFNREICICYYLATSSGQKGESKKRSAEGVYSEYWVNVKN